MSLTRSNTPTHFVNPGFLGRKFTVPTPAAPRLCAFETALSLTGFGRYQWTLVGVCGLMSLAAGYQSGLSAYVIPAAQCDLAMTSQDKGLLNAIFLMGGLASAFFWGLMADQIGRRPVLVFSVIADAAITAVSSTAQDFTFFAVFRFFNGFIIGAPSSIVCTYLGEFIGVRQRARTLIAMGFFFTLSWLLLPLVAMAILPMQWHFSFQGFEFNSWRLFVLLAAVPTALSGLLLALMFPESPKFLYSQGEEQRAVSVMRDMYTCNYGPCATFPVDGIMAESTEGSRSRRSVILERGQAKSATGKSVSTVVGGVWRQIVSLCRPPVASATCLAAALIFCNMFGYYGFGLWLPELFDRFNNHYTTSNQSVTVCQLTRLAPAITTEQFSTANVTEQGGNMTDACLGGNVHPSVYINTFIIGVVCLGLNAVCTLSANRIGLKLLSVLTCGVSGLCAAGMYVVDNTRDNLIASCLLLGSAAAANSVLTSAICDIFPTRIRGVGVCAAMFAGRLGAMLSNLTLGYMLDVYCELPVFLMAAVLLVGGVLSLLLPGKLRRKCVPVGST